MPDPAALMLERGGVVLADSADASRCYPDLWRTPAAARQAFHRARRVTGPAPDGPGAPCHAPLQRATYLRAGAGKRPASLVFDPAAVADLRGWLEKRVGPLARFDLGAAGEAPEPVSAELGGDPGPVGDCQRPEAARTAPAPSAAQPETVAARPPALSDRIRLFSLVQRLHDARPLRVHGVRELDRSAWEAAAKAAAGLPTGEWRSWRAGVRGGGARW